MPKNKKSKRAAGGRKCILQIFCKSEAKVTGEHLLSRRFHRLIPQTAKNFRVLRSVEHVNHSIFRHGKFHGDPRDQKIKCFCEKNCNNGWMRHLETKLDPLLVALFSGRDIRMTENDLADLATWAVMKAAVIQSTKTLPPITCSASPYMQTGGHRRMGGQFGWATTRAKIGR